MSKKSKTRLSAAPNLATPNAKLPPHAANWYREPSTGLVMFPSGAFALATHCHDMGERVTKLGEHPILRGMFDGSRFSPGAQSAGGWGTFGTGSRQLLAFRLQCDQDALLWLANPHDPEVWDALDRWDAAGTMTLAPQFSNRDGALLVNFDFRLSPQAERLRPVPGSDMCVEEYVIGVGALCLADSMAQMVPSDLSSHPRLRHVQPCIVSTANCPPVFAGQPLQGSDHRHVTLH